MSKPKKIIYVAVHTGSITCRANSTPIKDPFQGFEVIGGHWKAEQIACKTGQKDNKVSFQNEKDDIAVMLHRWYAL